MVVYFIESLGGATIGVLTPYMAQYVILEISFPLVVLTYMVASTVTVPLWTALSQRMGKKALWLSSMVVTSLGFGCFFFVGEGDVAVTYVLAFLLGAAGGCGNVIAPSVTSDVVDWDEPRRGTQGGRLFRCLQLYAEERCGHYHRSPVLPSSCPVTYPMPPRGRCSSPSDLYALFPLSCFAWGRCCLRAFP